ncbi:hypothetical protein ILUMI_23009 [Ignelater luminosus]|uniref:Transposase n=1 Tax=Ignelater luminosus TaxID=2038154 RepID=A0A8K0C9K3_IGNLU|nr:hypothetical protein ILUMI_23009 [Ignelater luminosus]
MNPVMASVDLMSMKKTRSSLKMPRKENEYFAKRVVHYLNNMAKADAKSTIQHFVKEGRRRTTVTRIIKRYKDTGKTEYAPIPDRSIGK